MESDSLLLIVGAAYLFMLVPVVIIAEGRNISVGQVVFLSILLSPIFGLLIIYMSERKKDAQLRNAALRAILKHLNEPIPGEEKSSNNTPPTATP